MALNKKIDLEEELIFGILKSSDLKQTVIDKTRKFTIITQKKVGQDTSFIKRIFQKHMNLFAEDKAQFDCT